MWPDLRRFLNRCARCKAHFVENVALIAHGDPPTLTEEQAAVVLGNMSEYHEQGHVYTIH